LPGTILAKEVKQRLVQRFLVHLLPPLAAPAYRVAGDRLEGPGVAETAVPLVDPRLMAVPLASEAVWQQERSPTASCWCSGFRDLGRRKRSR
jgi:hypothetical protein